MSIEKLVFAKYRKSLKITFNNKFAYYRELQLPPSTWFWDAA